MVTQKNVKNVIVPMSSNMGKEDVFARIAKQLLVFRKM